MVVRRRFAGAAVAGLLLLPLAACSDSSGGRGSLAGGGSSSRSSTASAAPSASPSPSRSASASVSASTGSTTAAPSPTASGPASSPRDPSTPIPPVATPVPSGNAVLGPTGWQTLQLGQTPAQARDTGMFADTPEPDGGCALWYAVNAAAIDSVAVSGVRGVAAITVSSSDKVIATPEGMAVGWTAAQVHAAYPSWPAGAESSPAGPPLIAVPQNPAAVYRLRLDGGAVIAITLESRNQDCYS